MPVSKTMILVPRIIPASKFGKFLDGHRLMFDEKVLVKISSERKITRFHAGNIVNLVPSSVQRVSYLNRDHNLIQIIGNIAPSNKRRP